MARRKLGFWYRFAVAVLKPPVIALARRDWLHLERLPVSGGIVVAPNHISYFDPLVVAHYLHDAGRPPRFLAKSRLFDIFFFGRVLRSAEQIPVYRETRDAGSSVRAAVEAVRAGECVVVYPEGTLTRDPDLWPMVGKTGAARIALLTGAPVIPLAVWGAQDVVPPYGRPDLLPRKTVHVSPGTPVDLDDLRGRPLSTDVLAEATGRIMAALTATVRDLRGGEAPAQPYDPREHGVPTTGNPHLTERAEADHDRRSA